MNILCFSKLSKLKIGVLFNLRIKFSSTCYPSKYCYLRNTFFYRSTASESVTSSSRVSIKYQNSNINVVSSVQMSALRGRCERFWNCHVSWVKGIKEVEWREQGGQVRRETFLSYSWIRLIGFCAYRDISFSRFLPARPVINVNS